MPAFAVGQAVSAMAAQNVGAANGTASTGLRRIGVIYSIAITGSVDPRPRVARGAGLLAVPAGGLAGLAIAAHLNHIATPSYMFFAIAMVLFATVRSTGAVMLPLDHHDGLAAAGALSAGRCLLPAIARMPSGGASRSPPRWRPFSRALYYKFGGWRAAHMLPVNWSRRRARAPGLACLGSIHKARARAQSFAVLVEDGGCRGVLRPLASQRPARDGAALADMHQAIDVHR